MVFMTLLIMSVEAEICFIVQVAQLALNGTNASEWAVSL
jgi:hypothetical protein